MKQKFSKNFGWYLDMLTKSVSNFIQIGLYLNPIISFGTAALFTRIPHKRTAAVQILSPGTVYMINAICITNFYNKQKLSLNFSD